MFKNYEKEIKYFFSAIGISIFLVVCTKVYELEKQNKELREKIQLNKNNISRAFEQNGFTRDVLDEYFYEIDIRIKKLEKNKECE